MSKTQKRPGRGQAMEDQLTNLLARDPANIFAARFCARLTACKTPGAKDAESDLILGEFRQFLQTCNAIMQRIAERMKPVFANLGRSFLAAAEKQRALQLGGHQEKEPT